MKKLIPIFISLFICTSCGEDFFETTLKIDPPPHEDQLVLHSFIKSSDSLVYVSLTKSIGILETNNSNSGAEYINDAAVELYENGTLKYNLTPTGGEPFNYKVELNDVFGGLGNSYEIKASHDDLATASAEQKMLAAPELTSAIFEEDGGLPSEYDYESNAIDILINDPVGENFYEIYLIFEDTIGGVVYSSEKSAESLDINTSEGLNRSILVDAASFDGEAYTLQIQTRFDWGENMRVYVRAISRDWFLYSKSLSDFRNSDDLEFFAEPVTVHTNIQNGLGVFAMGAETRIRVDKE